MKPTFLQNPNPNKNDKEVPSNLIKTYYLWMKTYTKILFLTIIVGMSISCRKIIDIDLNSAAPKLVVEANITDQPGPYKVTLATSVNFDESNYFPPATGATVVISDNAGNIDTLTETFPGNYLTNYILGVTGRIYTLNIFYGGKNYSAVSTLHTPVQIDSVAISTVATGGPGSGLTGGGGGGGGMGHSFSKTVTAYFHDPAGISNYYRLIFFKNTVEIKRLFVVEDRLQDGKNISIGLSEKSNAVVSGDLITVQMQPINKSDYDFFYTLNQLFRDGMQASTPANPTTNIEGGALGYFSAHALTIANKQIP
jgi:hypothetical protein